MNTVWALFEGEPGQDHTLYPFVHPHYVCKCDSVTRPCPNLYDV